jgi:multicomponent K+:H+ antiporter subunit E
VVLWDIVVSNITVAAGAGPHEPPPARVAAVPLASDHPRVNAMFASIITTTPGTVSATLDERRA